MQDEKLTRMANQIAAFWQTQPEADPAAAIARHLTAYWAPPMRARLRALAEDASLHPLARAAALRLDQPRA